MINSKLKIGLLVIATNKYIRFVKPLYRSAKNYFFKDHDVKMFLFTDHDIPKYDNTLEKIHIEHEPWPNITLKRYHFFDQYKSTLYDMDYLFYCDTDMRFVAEVNQKILPENDIQLIGVEHPGACLMPRPKTSIDKFLKRLHLQYRTEEKRFRGSYEANPISTAYVSPEEGEIYYAGGFNGGTSDAFLKMSFCIKKNVDKDLENNYIAVWHDESHLNRYFIDNPPKTLSPSYCYPESWDLPFQKILLALDKDHQKIRDD